MEQYKYTIYIGNNRKKAIERLIDHHNKIILKGLKRAKVSVIKNNVQGGEVIKPYKDFKRTMDYILDIGEEIGSKVEEKEDVESKGLDDEVDEGLDDEVDEGLDDEVDEGLDDEVDEGLDDEVDEILEQGIQYIEVEGEEEIIKFYNSLSKGNVVSTVYTG